VPQLPEHVKPFQLIGGHLALDFANTLDNRFHPDGPLELLSTYDRLLAFSEQAGVLTGGMARHLRRQTHSEDATRALRRAVALREAVYALLAAAVAHTDPPIDALDTLNEVLGEAERTRVVAWEKPDFVWRARDVVERPTAPLWAIAQAAADLLTSPDIAHVRECGSETCRWLFLDRSRNHSRRWCDMKTCGNRRKASRFHARQHRAQMRSE
jgi:predicted RNA-binding Zn ribbon-like protein